MKHKALIGFNLTEYPEAGIFKDFLNVILMSIRMIFLLAI